MVQKYIQKYLQRALTNVAREIVATSENMAQLKIQNAIITLNLKKK